MSELVEIGPGTSLSVETAGEGPPLVLVGGLGDDHTLFDPLVPLLRDRWTCVAFDNRGTGASSDAPAEMTIADLADDAHRLVDRLGLRDPIAIGCSMGGMIVQEWALRHPADLRAAVLISTHAKPGAASLAALDRWENLHEAGETEVLREGLGLRAVPPGLIAQLHACRHHDAVDRLGQIQIPTLVVAGSEDEVIPAARGVELAAAIPKAELRVLPAGHVPFWERPEESAAAIARFCASYRERGARA